MNDNDEEFAQQMDEEEENARRLRRPTVSHDALISTTSQPRAAASRPVVVTMVVSRALEMLLSLRQLHQLALHYDEIRYRNENRLGGFSDDVRRYVPTEEALSRVKMRGHQAVADVILSLKRFEEKGWPDSLLPTPILELLTHGRLVAELDNKARAGVPEAEEKLDEAIAAEKEFTVENPTPESRGKEPPATQQRRQRFRADVSDAQERLQRAQEDETNGVDLRTVVRELASLDLDRLEEELLHDELLPRDLIADRLQEEKERVRRWTEGEGMRAPVLRPHATHPMRLYSLQEAVQKQLDLKTKNPEKS